MNGRESTMRDAGTCYICGQIAGNARQDLISLLLNEQRYQRRAILESENFIVFPSIGPLVLGHVLLCPKSHVCGISQSIDHLSAEYQEIKQTTVALLQDVYRSGVHCFEHGGAPASDRLICSVGHAHMHLLPATVDVLDRLQLNGRWVPLRLHERDLISFAGPCEYLFYETPTGASYGSLAASHPIESQYMRRVFADALGCPDEWNWRTHPQLAVLEKTTTSLSSAARKRNL
jgi:ATP adenylyltransferase